MHGNFFWLKHNEIILASSADNISDYRIEIKNEPLAKEEKIDLDINLSISENKSQLVCSSDNLENEKKLAAEEKEKARQEEIAKRRETARIAEASQPKVISISCKKSNYGHPSKSDTKGKHVDEDCCPDPDEWPKPGCVYDAKGYAIMLKGPRK